MSDIETGVSLETSNTMSSESAPSNVFTYLFKGPNPIPSHLPLTLSFTCSGNDPSKPAASQFLPVVYSTGIKQSETTFSPSFALPFPCDMYGISGNPGTSSKMVLVHARRTARAKRLDDVLETVHVSVLADEQEAVDGVAGFVAEA